MALSFLAFAYGIAARFRQPRPGLSGDIAKLKACIAYLEAENARLLDRLSVRLDELEAAKRQLAEARIEARLDQYVCGQMHNPLAQYHQLQAMQNAFAHPWVNEIADCCGGGRTRHLLGTIGGA